MLVRGDLCVGTTAEEGYGVSSGRPVGTTAEEGYGVSPGRPVGTTVEEGYGVSSGRPVGTTAEEGYGVSPCRETCGYHRKEEGYGVSSGWLPDYKVGNRAEPIVPKNLLIILFQISTSSSLLFKHI